MTRKRVGTRRALFASGAPAPAVWPFGTDGALVIDNTVVNLVAGSTKDYSSITIINNGQLRIVYNLATPNGGNIPTIIGCSGNCTINTGGTITANQNALDLSDDTPDSYPYSNTPPAGAVVSPVTYNAVLGEGGIGGPSGLGGGGSSAFQGHGGGGGGLDPGDDSLSSPNWGTSGAGGQNSDSIVAPGVSPIISGFSQFGNMGELADYTGFGGDAAGGGGSGGTRGLNGGCVYLQVKGTLSVSGVVFQALGSNGGSGGGGGDALTEPGSMANGGGGGGGGAAGNGGKWIIRYKLGSANAGNCNVSGGTAGPGGPQGFAAGGDSNVDGNPGSDGAPGIAGTTDIASY
jgi:hypothetical protein